MVPARPVASRRLRGVIAREESSSRATSSDRMNRPTKRPIIGERGMAHRIQVGGLKVHEGLYDLVRDEIAPGTGIDPDAFWESLGAIVRDLGPKNRQLLERREALQARIDE